jgi:thymidylate kinase
MKPNLPKFIFLTGVDGTGKTSLSRILRKHLKQNGLKIDIVWSRFNNYSSLPFLAITRLSGHNYYLKYGNTLFGFHNFENLSNLRYLFAFLQALDVNIACYKNILRPQKKNDIIICERGPCDTLVDVISDTGLFSLMNNNIGKLFLCMIPKSSKTILISRTKDNIVNSRPELQHDNKLEMRMRLYDDLAKKFHWNIVDNNSSLETAKKQILAHMDL